VQVPTHAGQATEAAQLLAEAMQALPETPGENSHSPRQHVWATRSAQGNAAPSRVIHDTSSIRQNPPLAVIPQIKEFQEVVSPKPVHQHVASLPPKVVGIRDSEMLQDSMFLQQPMNEKAQPPLHAH